MQIHIYIHINTHLHAYAHIDTLLCKPNTITSGSSSHVNSPHDCSASLTTTQTEVCNVPPWNNEIRSINTQPKTEYTMLPCLYDCVPHCFKSWPNKPRRIWGNVKRCEWSTESISALCHNFFRSDLMSPLKKNGTHPDHQVASRWQRKTRAFYKSCWESKQCTKFISDIHKAVPSTSTAFVILPSVNRS